jgi:predicted methyltransferase
MNDNPPVQFAIPGKCQFAMALDSDRRTQRMIGDEQKLSGFYEGQYSLFVAALLRPGDWVADVGAHVGYYTLLAAAIVGETGHVFAFEPAPDNLEYLSKNIGLNKLKNVSVVASAAGAGMHANIRTT